MLADHAHKLLFDSAFRCIPYSRFGDHAAVVPGWIDNCAELRKQSLHWHRMWADCGRPQAGTVADIMRASRKKYHCSILQARKREADIRNEKVAEALVLGDCVNFWREVNRAGFLGQPSCYSAIGGSTTPADIADDFWRMYAFIYHADFVNTNELKHFRTELDLKCAAENLQLFTYAEVAAACKQLKPFKKDSDLLLNSSALINVPVIFFDFLCDLFNAIILHGYVPSSWKNWYYYSYTEVWQP